MKKIIVRLSILLFLSGFFFSCEKKERSSIPDCEVYIEIREGTGQYAILRLIGEAVSYAYTPGVQVPANFRFGFGGVLIYRDLEGRIRSCDLACPVEAQPTVRVKVTMPFAECPACGSKFDLSWGFAVPVAGPARESLRSYHASERATSIVVSN